MFYSCFLENRFLTFMQIVSSEDNLHELSNPVFCEKIVKYLSFAELAERVVKICSHGSIQFAFSYRF